MVFITTTASASRISGILPASFPGQVTQDCQALGPVLCKARVSRVGVPRPVTGSHTSPVWTLPGFQASGPHKAWKHVSPKPWAPHKRLWNPSYSSSLYCGSGCPPTWLRGERKAFHPEQGTQSWKTRGPKADFSGFWQCCWELDLAVRLSFLNMFIEHWLQLLNTVSTTSNVDDTFGSRSWSLALMSKSLKIFFSPEVWLRFRAL